VYGPDGGVAVESANLRGKPPAASELVARTMERGDTAFEGELDGDRVQILLRSLRPEDGHLIGAFELTTPLSFVESEIARTRTRFLLNTATLLVALTALTFWVVRRQIGDPLARLVAGVRAVGRGELAFRVEEDPRAADLAAVAHEFNRMAEQLEHAREDLLKEADERVELERRFRESDKLAAVGKLAAGLAHEIATPLQIIKGRTDMLRRKEVPQDVYARNLRIMGEQIDRVTSLVRGLLNLSRRPELRITHIDVGELVREVCDLLDAELTRAGVDLELELASGAVTEGDHNLLNQALTNILLNAVQALEGQPGLRRIVVRSHLARGTPASRRGAPQQRIVIEVEDNGPGLPPDGAERVFEPFYSTKLDAHGTGLGLSIAKSIVEEHRGSLVASNVAPSDDDGADPRGACFRIELPAAALAGAVA
jgi:signal transduction histidine kinase